MREKKVKPTSEKSNRNEFMLQKNEFLVFSHMYEFHIVMEKDENLPVKEKDVSNLFVLDPNNPINNAKII